MVLAQDSMVLTHRLVEQNKEPRNGPSTLWSTHIQQSRKEYPMEKRQSLQQMVLREFDSHMQKNETGPLSDTIHTKENLKMDKRPNCEAGIYQNPKGDHRQQPL